MASNTTVTDINTSQLDNKEIKALWSYDNGRWKFYSSDEKLLWMV